METQPKSENVPVRQDIMPPNPRAAALRQPAGVELVDHIPVREANQFGPQAVAQPQPVNPVPKPEDKDLDNILKAVNQQVASTDMSPKKKKRFGFSKKSNSPGEPQTVQAAVKPSKPNKISVVEGTAVLVAMGLIALTVKIYH